MTRGAARAAQVVAGVAVVGAPVWVPFTIDRPLAVLAALLGLGVLFVVLDDVSDDPHPEPAYPLWDVDELAEQDDR